MKKSLALILALVLCVTFIGCSRQKDYLITAAEAKEIALKHAELTESKVTRLKANREREDAQTIYEVDFRYASMEYSYEINAFDGSIIAFETEPLHD